MLPSTKNSIITQIYQAKSMAYYVTVTPVAQQCWNSF